MAAARPEYRRFRPGKHLITYRHLAADKQFTESLLERKIDSITYETVQTRRLEAPLLTQPHGEALR